MREIPPDKNNNDDIGGEPEVEVGFFDRDGNRVEFH